MSKEQDYQHACGFYNQASLEFNETLALNSGTEEFSKHAKNFYTNALSFYGAVLGIFPGHIDYTEKHTKLGEWILVQTPHQAISFYHIASVFFADVCTFYQANGQISDAAAIYNAARKLHIKAMNDSKPVQAIAARSMVDGSSGNNEEIVFGELNDQSIESGTDFVFGTLPPVPVSVSAPAPVPVSISTHVPAPAISTNPKSTLPEAVVFVEPVVASKVNLPVQKSPSTIVTPKVTSTPTSSAKTWVRRVSSSRKSVAAPTTTPKVLPEWKFVATGPKSVIVPMVKASDSKREEVVVVASAPQDTTPATASKQKASTKKNKNRAKTTEDDFDLTSYVPPTSDSYFEALEGLARAFPNTRDQAKIDQFFKGFSKQYLEAVQFLKASSYEERYARLYTSFVKQIMTIRRSTSHKDLERVEKIFKDSGMDPALALNNAIKDNDLEMLQYLQRVQSDICNNPILDKNHPIYVALTTSGCTRDIMECVIGSDANGQLRISNENLGQNRDFDIFYFAMLAISSSPESALPIFRKLAEEFHIPAVIEVNGGRHPFLNLYIKSILESHNSELVVSRDLDLKVFEYLLDYSLHTNATIYDFYILLEGLILLETSVVGAKNVAVSESNELVRKECIKRLMIACPELIAYNPPNVIVGHKATPSLLYAAVQAKTESFKLLCELGFNYKMVDPELGNALNLAFLTANNGKNSLGIIEYILNQGGGGEWVVGSMNPVYVAIPVTVLHALAKLRLLNILTVDIDEQIKRIQFSLVLANPEFFPETYAEVIAKERALIRGRLSSATEEESAFTQFLASFNGSPDQILDVIKDGELHIILRLAIEKGELSVITALKRAMPVLFTHMFGGEDYPIFYALKRANASIDLLQELLTPELKDKLKQRVASLGLTVTEDFNLSQKNFLNILLILSVRHEGDQELLFFQQFKERGLLQIAQVQEDGEVLGAMIDYQLIMKDAVKPEVFTYLLEQVRSFGLTQNYQDQLLYSAMRVAVKFELVGCMKRTSEVFPYVFSSAQQQRRSLLLLYAASQNKFPAFKYLYELFGSDASSSLSPGLEYGNVLDCAMRYCRDATQGQPNMALVQYIIDKRGAQMDLPGTRNPMEAFEMVSDIVLSFARVNQNILDFKNNMRDIIISIFYDNLEKLGFEQEELGPVEEATVNGMIARATEKIMDIASSATQEEGAVGPNVARELQRRSESKVEQEMVL